MTGTNGGNGNGDRFVLRIVINVASLGLAVTFVGALMERNADRIERSHHEDMVLMQAIGDKAVEGHHQILMELQAQRLRRGDLPTPPPRPRDDSENGFGKAKHPLPKMEH